MTIDWNSFTGNVKVHKVDTLGKTTRELLEMYVNNEPFPEGADPEFSFRLTSQIADGFTVPTFPQPDSVMRLAMMDAVMLNLREQDEAFMYSSIEGDFCLWNIHLAEKLDKGNDLCAMDWQHFLYFETMIENNEFEDGDTETGPMTQLAAEEILEKLKQPGVMEIAKKYENTKTIFNTILC